MGGAVVGGASIEELLKTANGLFQMVTIHREKVDPGVCEMGRVVGVSGGKVSLLEIDTDARWDAVPREYVLRDITRVDFGGAYEDALHLVGGRPGAG